MQLDECRACPAPEHELRRAIATLARLGRGAAKRAFEQAGPPNAKDDCSASPGGDQPDSHCSAESASVIMTFEFDGYAIGWDRRRRAAAGYASDVEGSCLRSRQIATRYLRGVGTPEDLLRRGTHGSYVDCVLSPPHRQTWSRIQKLGPSHLKNARHVDDTRPDR